MRSRHNANVDEFIRAVDLYDEWHHLTNSRRGIICAKRAHIVTNLVVSHREFIGKTIVLVGIDPDVVAGSIPQHGEYAAAAGWVAIAVDVATNLAAQERAALVE